MVCRTEPVLAGRQWGVYLTPKGLGLPNMSGILRMLPDRGAAFAAPLESDQFLDLPIGYHAFPRQSSQELELFVKNV